MFTKITRMYAPRRMLFGPGCLEQIGEEIKRLGASRVLLVSDPGVKAAGLVEDLPWASPPVVSAAERARLAKALGQGKPLSEIIIEEREDRA